MRDSSDGCAAVVAEIGELLAAGLQRLWPGSPALKLPTPEKVRSTSRPTRAVIRRPQTGERRMTDTVLAQLAALKTAPIGALKQKWRDLFETRAAAL